jgi:hypothetical protein
MPPRLDQMRQAIDRRNRTLAERIREGHADDGPWRGETLAHCRRIVYDKLEVANPRLAAEGRAEMQKRA